MAHMTIADLSIEEFEQLVRAIVKQVLVETLSDPDQGLEVRDELVVELRESARRVNEAAPTYSAEDVATRLGLSW